MKKNLCKKVFALVLSFGMLIQLIPTAFATQNSAFVDFPTGWSAEAVSAAVANGLLKGRTPATLVPDGYLTRAEMATVINRAFGATKTADISSFGDVLPSDWFYTEIAKAVNMQTFQGDTSGLMRPNDPVSREEVFAVIARALVLETSDFSVLSSHPDGASVSEWAKPYAAILSQKGYINGDENAKLNPQSYITREEFAQVMHNIIKTYYTAEGTYSTSGSASSLIRTTGVTLKNVTIEGDLIIGDGVGNGTVVLDGVTIKGRLLARGGEGSVKLINTKVGDKVVVKDVNGIVNFDNYRTEAPFKNLVEITKAKFKTSSGGSGVTTSYKLVKFYEGAKPDATKLISRAKVKNGTSMTTSEIESALSSIMPYANAEHGYVDGPYTHLIYPDLWYITSEGEWKAFDESVVINSDMNVFYAFKSISLFLDLGVGSYNLAQPVSFSVPYQRNTRVMDTLKDALTLGRNQINIALNADDIYEKAIMQEASRTKGLIDSSGNIKYVEVDTAISKIIRPSEIEGEIRDYIINIIVENSDDEKIESAIRMVQDSHLIENEVLGGGAYNFTLVKNYITSKTPAQREAFAIDVYNLLKAKQYYIDFIDAFESDHSNFEVTHENLDFVMAVATAVKEYTYEGLKDRIYDKFGKIINVIGDDIAREFMEDSQDRYYDGAQTLWDDMKAHEGDPTYTSQYPSYLTFKVDPISQVFKPVFNKYRVKVINKLTEDYYYAQNTYLSDLAGIDADTLISELFYPVAVTEDNVGYALWPSNASESGFMHYYDYITEKIILLDKALLWYEDNLTPSQLEDMKQSIYELMAKSLNKLNTFIDAYELDGSLPLGMNIDELKSFGALGSIIEKVEPKLNTAINKYKSTRFYTTNWTEDLVKNDISVSQLMLDVLFGTDNPVFNADALMDHDVTEKVIEKAGFSAFTDTFDQDMGYTVTVQAIERIFRQNHIKVRRFYW